MGPCVFAERTELFRNLCQLVFVIPGSPLDQHRVIIFLQTVRRSSQPGAPFRHRQIALTRSADSRLETVQKDGGLRLQR
jgi:hypothetical protein